MTRCLVIFFLFLSACPVSYAQHTALSFNKMNVVYTGVENPITIVVEHTKGKELVVTTDNGEIARDLSDENSSHYTLHVYKPGKAIITVSVKTPGGRRKLKEFTYRVHSIPPPVVRLSGKTGGSISRAMLCAQIAPNAPIDGFGYDAKALIYRCKITVTRDNEITYEKTLADAHGVRFDENTKKVFCTLTKGAEVWITDVAAKGPGSDYTELNDLKFTIE